MNRIQYLQLVVVLAAMIVLAVVGIVVWVVMVIPVMIYPRLVAGVSLTGMAGFGVRRMMQNGRAKRPQPTVSKEIKTLPSC